MSVHNESLSASFSCKLLFLLNEMKFGVVMQQLKLNPLTLLFSEIS